VFLRLLRAVDVLTQQPEWDGRRVIANGRSQGGATGLAAGGIDPRITCVVVEIPGMCDHTGVLANRMVAWPRYLSASPNAQADPKVVEAIRYYDAVNFASRIKVPTFLTLGWTDHICPPTGVYAAYNQLKGPKKVLDLTNLSHFRSVEGDTFVRASIKEYVASSQQ
jgi:cephalosporin-C deacetylase-like acetyl esterase